MQWRMNSVVTSLPTPDVPFSALTLEPDSINSSPLPSGWMPTFVTRGCWRDIEGQGHPAVLSVLFCLPPGCPGTCETLRGASPPASCMASPWPSCSACGHPAGGLLTLAWALPLRTRSGPTCLQCSSTTQWAAALSSRKRSESHSGEGATLPNLFLPWLLFHSPVLY